MTVACWSRIVVRPNEPLSRAYSSLPTRISVFSSSCTTVASTFSRGSPLAQVGAGALADARQRLRERDQPAVLRLVAHLAPARVIAVLLAPARVAAGGLEMPARIGQIQTSVHAGGIDQRLDALQLGAVGDRAPFGLHVAHARGRADAPDAGRRSSLT